MIKHWLHTHLQHNFWLFIALSINYSTIFLTRQQGIWYTHRMLASSNISQSQASVDFKYFVLIAFPTSTCHSQHINARKSKKTSLWLKLIFYNGKRHTLHLKTKIFFLGEAHYHLTFQKPPICSCILKSHWFSILSMLKNRNKDATKTKWLPHQCIMHLMLILLSKCTLYTGLPMVVDCWQR